MKFILFTMLAALGIVAALAGNTKPRAVAAIDQPVWINGGY